MFICLSISLSIISRNYSKTKVHLDMTQEQSKYKITIKSPFPNISNVLSKDIPEDLTILSKTNEVFRFHRVLIDKYIKLVNLYRAGDPPNIQYRTSYSSYFLAILKCIYVGDDYTEEVSIFKLAVLMEDFFSFAFTGIDRIIIKSIFDCLIEFESLPEIFHKEMYEKARYISRKYLQSSSIRDILLGSYKHHILPQLKENKNNMLKLWLILLFTKSEFYVENSPIKIPILPLEPLSRLLSYNQLYYHRLGIITYEIAMIANKTTPSRSVLSYNPITKEEAIDIICKFIENEQTIQYSEIKRESPVEVSQPPSKKQNTGNNSAIQKDTK